MVPFLTWLVLILYTGAIIGVAVQVIYETTSPSKTLGYLLLIIFVPLLGVILYLSIGVNYRNRNMYSKKVMADDATEAEVKRYIKTL
ncbi:cardiolipin synthase, partial [Pseudomonas aeruginosa]